MPTGPYALLVVVTPRKRGSRLGLGDTPAVQPELAPDRPPANGGRKRGVRLDLMANYRIADTDNPVIDPSILVIADEPVILSSRPTAALSALVVAVSRETARDWQAPSVPTALMPSAETLLDLKLSPEVAWYLISRGFKLPELWQVPLYKTPEPGELVPGARFDAGRVDKVLSAFSHLRHTKGEWAGHPLVPDVWQVAYIIAPVFGWVDYGDDPDQLIRMVRELYVEVPRKNGKSTLIGGLGLYMTCADGEQGAEGVAAATNERQAGYVFSPVKALVRSSPALKPFARAFAKKIIHTETSSEFAVVSSVAEGMHGANLHFYCVDELHVHKSPELVETIETGTGSRRQPLGVLITTADEGRPDTIYVRKRNRIVQLAARTFIDPSTYGVIWAVADSEEEADRLGIDLFSEDAQRRANPGFGVSPTRSYLARAATVAKQSPSDRSSYLRLHLGIRTRQATTYITIPSWDRNMSIVDTAKLKGCKAFGGLDLAATSDFTAFSLLFPDGTGGYDVLWRLWLPEAAYTALVKRTSKVAEVWRREGRFKVTDGDVVDDEVIVADIWKDCVQYKVAEIGYDPWNASAITNALTKKGAKLVEVRQGYGSLSAPLKEIKRLVMMGRPDRPMFRHGGHPVARWMLGNLAVGTDDNGNVKPDRKRSADKIDGIAASTIAMQRAMAAPATRRSAYEDHGLEVAK
jgi:phage terminase large subunit-like protein